ncbi:hypothetical protein [Persicirhabdus sediminis]|uniref:Uncharacterized protein n=1 Tax=Persicirhabdus sediminis TaxID=454144 RepID=A0A8J7MD13_9BACT|nr:hypothetical protein [Persicirhabdus sediminis]MBK1791499.1 hypothetical protein [Persicirhabdus sediminis]
MKTLITFLSMLVVAIWFSPSNDPLTVILVFCILASVAVLSSFIKELRRFNRRQSSTETVS